MVKKFEYIAEHNGQTFTRTSHRTYTHVIVGRWAYEPEGTPLFAITWCGTPALADKAFGSKRNMKVRFHEPERGRYKGMPSMAEVAKIPVQVKK
jgi:hypothetical protein